MRSRPGGGEPVIGGAFTEGPLPCLRPSASDGCFVAAYPLRRPKHSAMYDNAAFVSAASPAPSTMAVARSWAMGSGSRASSRIPVPLSGRGPVSAGRARATTRARSRDWSASPAELPGPRPACDCHAEQSRLRGHKETIGRRAGSSSSLRCLLPMIACDNPTGDAVAGAIPQHDYDGHRGAHTSMRW